MHISNERTGEKMPDNPQYNWVDPTLIEADGQVVIVLVDDRRGFFSWFIKAHESGNYNHAMFMVKRGMLATQANVFKEVPVLEYMKDGVFLKLWRIKNTTPDEVAAIIGAINKTLALPWWKRSYDFLGLLGQSFRFLHWMQIPGWYFCSEIVSAFLRLSWRFDWLPKEPSPSDLDRIFKQHQNDIEVLGYWFSD
jgi:hypothetical protein